MKNLFSSDIKIQKWALNFLKKSNFSIIHNYHSPHTLWQNGKYVRFDEKLEEYNEYIQAFLTKRFTHKKEVPPKIKVIKIIDNCLKEYHNTFYIQTMYPMYTLVDYNYLKFMNIHKLYDTGYILSRFCEDYEKNVMDSMLEKVLICGRVEFLEDKEKFDDIKIKVDKLIDVFYNGDRLSPFEREIERTYLYIKQEKFNELLFRYNLNKKKTVGECLITFSERNKLSGHVNFRMKHPSYFFYPRPIFEIIDVKRMFNSLYEIRYNTLKFYQLYSKLKLKFQYRKSLLKTSHRVEFITIYLYLQIYQYLECYEFNNEFNLSLNFKINFNLIVFHCWLIINRLQKIAAENSETKNFCNFIIEGLLDKLVENFKNNFDKFQFSQNQLPQIIKIKIFINKILDFYTWHFEVLNKSNVLENLTNLLRDSIFINTFSKDDINLKKFCYYSFIHYEYLKTKTYKDIETNNFDFSINRIPIQFEQYVTINDKLSIKYKFYQDYIESNDQQFIESSLQNYYESKNLFFNKIKLKSKENSEIYNQLVNIYGLNPFNDPRNFFWIDTTKGIYPKLDWFFKGDVNIMNGYEMEKIKHEAELSKPLNIGSVWDSNKEDEFTVLGYVDIIKEKRNLYLNEQKIKENKN